VTATDTERQQAFRRFVGSFPTGVCVVTSEHEGRPAGMTLNSFTSVSLDPLLVLVSLAHGSRTLDAVRRAQRYAVSVLHRGQREIALEFASSGGVFPETYVRRTRDGFVLIRHALTHLSCDVNQVIPAGDHDLVLGRVLDFDGEPGEPLVFYAGQFGGVATDSTAPASFLAFLDEGIGW
jgi:flavin reductase (DIM6/NTAB) family NADH-FMN oxidoreductase RutF